MGGTLIFHLLWAFLLPLALVECVSYQLYLERRLSVTNLSSENNFADISTECSSRHQGESERSAKKCEEVHFCPEDDWSIQSKHRQVIFRTQVGNR